MPQQGTYAKRYLCPTGTLAAHALRGHIASVLSNNVSALRKAARLSQTQLAEAIGTSLNMLGKLERGERDLTSTWIEKISQELGVEPYLLFAPAGHAPAATSDDTEMELPTPEVLSVVLDVIAADLAGAPLPASAIRPAGRALELCLQLLARNPAIRANPDAARAVAQAAISPPPLATQEA